jgi:hypothetical protein
MTILFINFTSGVAKLTNFVARERRDSRLNKLFRFYDICLTLIRPGLGTASVLALDTRCAQMEVGREILQVFAVVGIFHESCKRGHPCLLQSSTARRIDSFGPILLQQGRKDYHACAHSPLGTDAGADNMTGLSQPPIAPTKSPDLSFGWP